VAAFAKDVRREFAPSAMAADEAERVDASQIALVGADAVVLDERSMQAVIARDAERQMAVPDVMKVRGGRHKPVLSVPFDENKMRTTTR